MTSQRLAAVGADWGELVRIGIDLASVVPERGAGVRRYTTCLIPALDDLSDDHEYVLFVNQHNRDWFPSGGRFTQQVVRLPVHRFAWPARIFWEQVLAPFHARRLALDVIHFPMNVVPLVLPTRSVVTIMDLISDICYPEMFPDAIGRVRAAYLRAAKRRASRRALGVICPSEATASAMTRHYGIPREKITVIPLAAAAGFRSNSGATHPAANSKRPYILSVVSLSRHKNIEILVEAFARARARYALNHELRIVGLRGRGADRIQRFLAEQAPRDVPVRYEGFVDEISLVNLYRGAELFVYVPIVEGFGIPPLEAMTMGVPVVASDTSSVPEVCGDAALLVSPTSTDEICDSIGRVLTTPDLARTMAEAGREHAKKFSWADSARRTRAVYEHAGSFETKRRSKNS